MSDDVPRETPPMPEVARAAFGDGWPRAAAYADRLCTDGVVRGLIGPREAARVWERHLLNCVVLSELIEPGATVCDLGSGAGLPGLVLAIARPDLRVTLVEPLLRRTTFLTEVVEALALTSVEVVRARADALHGERTFDVVTSRAVAPLPRLMEWSVPLVRADGVVLALKGRSAARELDEAGPDLASWRAGAASTLEVGARVIDPPTTVIRVVVTATTRLRWEALRRSRHSTSEGARRRRQQRRGRR